MTGDLKLLADKLGRGTAQFRHVPRAYALVRKAAGGWTLAWLVLLALQGLVPVVIVALTKPLVDCVAEAIRVSGSGGTLASALGLAAAMAAAVLAGEVLRAAGEWVGNVQSKRVEDHVSSLIHAQSTTVDLSFYEWPEFHDHLHRARHEARFRPVALLENCASLIQNGITFAAMAAVLFAFGWWMSLALLASALPALAVILRYAVRQHRWHLSVTADERRASYQDWLMTASEVAAELRLFGFGDALRATYRDLRARLRGEQLQLELAQARAELAAGLFAMAIAGACMAWVLWRAIQGHGGLGDLALFYVAFSQGQQLIRSLLGGVGRLYYNVLFLGNLFAFLDLESRVVTPSAPRPFPEAVPGTRGLAVRFEGVGFSYPESARPALCALDLDLRPGEVAAIVGANGAGKSTLAKLLCRFYDPDAGRILLGGEDLRSLPLAQLRDSISVLLQEPVRYDTTVAGNIAVGPLGERAALDEIKIAARAAGAEELIARLPRGYETLLGRWFEGGVELSVGEWQRLALARAFLRPTPLIVLDEPTSAMDSWAEADWLQRLRSLAVGRTVLLITHRFSTAMQADVIHVMGGGRIVESGRHEDLVARAGAYASSWEAQARSRSASPV